jgi:hypothetical protein
MKLWYLILVLLLIGCDVSKRVVTTPKTIILDGSKSYVSGGNGKGYIISFYWQQKAGQSVKVSNQTLQSISLMPLHPGDYAFQLKVIDNLGNKDSTIYSITVK